MGRISDVALDCIPLRSKCFNKYSCLLSFMSEQAIPGKSLSELVHGRAPCPRSTPSFEGHCSWGLDYGGYMSSRTGDASDGNMAHAVTCSLGGRLMREYILLLQITANEEINILGYFSILYLGMEKTTALVTGGTSGIGYACALQLASRDIRVILGARDKEKGDNVVKRIKEEVHGADVHLGPVLDLSKQDSIRNFVRKYKWPLHVLVNNAGVNSSDDQHYQGIVPHIVQVNFLGPFLLTRLLKRKMMKHAGRACVQSRVVNVSSVMHRLTKYQGAESFLKGSNPASLYADSKFANVLFTSELDSKWGPLGIRSVAVDPGSVVTGIWKGSKWERRPWSWILNSVFAPSSDGATSLVHAATVDHSESPLYGLPRKRRDRQSCRTNSSISAINHCEDSPNFRYYARGAFSWPTLTNMPSTATVHNHGIIAKMMAFNALVHAMLDWPLVDFHLINWAAKRSRCRQTKQLMIQSNRSSCGTCQPTYWD